MADIVNFVILLAVTIIVVGAFIAPMADFFIATNATGIGAGTPGNLTGAVGTLSGLVPVIFIVAVLLIIWATAKKGGSK